MKEESHPQKTEACDRKPHDRPAIEGYQKRGCLALLASGLGCADIGFCRGFHAEKAGGYRTERSADEANRRLGRQFPSEQQGSDHDKYGQDLVFPPQEGHGAGLNQGGNLTHAFAAVRATSNADVYNEGNGQAEKTAIRC